ncbi:MAG: DedA family protein [Cellvibrionales bacterium]|jgi:membrane-associated protein|nr:DedA family protein [Cellvibrionales bacterium]MBK8675924.1 DedA family protein [Cellvibrionales bacterium]TXH49147.1 MAG: DedA family protein [Cellvibrionales bacterium]HRF87211.1 DedA family protein [Pseudomonadales bacterium]HRG49673.1 DedA family protein [Pseudomonadales bacterium]
MNPLDFILHINDHLAVMIETYGVWVYAILFLIVFAETGLVVTPFLPGDSLLFAVGALAASTGKLDPVLCGVIVIAAAFCGDNVNYWIGRTLGPRVFRFEDSIFFNRKHLERTEQFYNKYGTRAVIIARFVPIVRTFAPFVAGIGKMPYPRYIMFSCIGSLLWAPICIGAGVFFGDMEIVKKNFELVILGVIAVSLIPIAVEVVKAKLGKSQ